MEMQENMKAAGVLTTFGNDDFGKMVGKTGEASLVKTAEGVKFHFSSDDGKAVRTSPIRSISGFGNTLCGTSQNGRSFSVLLTGKDGLWTVPNGEKTISYNKGWFLNSGKINKDGEEVSVELTVNTEGELSHALLTSGKTWMCNIACFQYFSKELLGADGEWHSYTVLDIRTKNGSNYTAAF